MTTLYYYNSSFDLFPPPSSPIILAGGNVSLISSLEINGDYIIANGAGYVEAVFQVQLLGSTVPLVESFRFYAFVPTAGALVAGGKSTRPSFPLPANTGVNLVWVQTYNVKQLGLTVNFSGSGP